MSYSCGNCNIGLFAVEGKAPVNCWVCGSTQIDKVGGKVIKVDKVVGNTTQSKNYEVPVTISFVRQDLYNLGIEYLQEHKIKFEEKRIEYLELSITFNSQQSLDSFREHMIIKGLWVIY